MNSPKSKAKHVRCDQPSFEQKEKKKVDTAREWITLNGTLRDTRCRLEVVLCVCYNNTKAAGLVISQT